jgi:hypothetical protein
MSTVQANLLKFAQRVDPVAKGTSSTAAGQKFKGSTDGTTLISIASNGGAGLVRVTSTGHGLVTGQYCTIYGAAGTGATTVNNTAGNPAWVVTRITADTFDLVGSTYSAAVTASTGTITGTMVGSVDGARFTRGRLLDIYNEARMALFNALYETKSSDEFSKYVYGTALNANLTFAYSSPYTSAAIPTGYIRLIGITAYNSSRIIVLPNNLLPETLPGTQPNLTVSATNLLAFQIGSNFKIPGSFATEAGDGSSSHYATINYYGISTWTWVTDVFPNGTVETFSSDVEPVLIELAVAIANEQSNASVLELAKTLLNKKE